MDLGRSGWHVHINEYEAEVREESLKLEVGDRNEQVIRYMLLFVTLPFSLQILDRRLHVHMNHVQEAEEW
jgi:hypothetical protein